MAKKIELKGPIMDNDTAWIYHWLGWDATCPKDLARALREANGEDIILEVNSPGGYCDYAFEMYTALMEYTGNVEAHIICAASAMTIICCAADKRLISDTGMYMIHNTQASGSGDYRDMIQIAECLSEYNESALNAYERCTGKDRAELKEIMDHTTWMSPKTAIEQGFVDDLLFGEINSGNGGDPASGTDPDNSGQMMATMSINMPGMGIPKEKLAKMMVLIRNMESKPAEGEVPQGMPVPENMQNISGKAESDKNGTVNNEKGSEEGGTHMTLQELLKDDPEAQAEFDQQLASAKAEGVAEENERLRSLDAISTSVSAENLTDAKYGKNRMDAKTLAYKALVEDGAKAQAYLAQAQSDAADAHVDDVGGSAASAEDGMPENADAMAAYVNAQKGGK